LTKLKKTKIFVLVSALFYLSLFYFPSQAQESISCDQYQVNGGDQAFLMNLNTPLKWGETIYNGNIYVSPKGTITFGVGDYTYWTYPSAPSISIAAYDYHAFANNDFWGAGNDLYVKYGSSSTHVCVDWKVMLWGQSSGEPVYIRMIAYVNPETYEWTPTYQVSSNAPSDARYGARYEVNGEVFPLEIQFVNEPPSPEVTIPPSPEPSEEPSPEPSEEPSPEPSEEPSPEPSEEPSPEPSEQPSPEPSEEPSPEPSPQASSEPSESPLETSTPPTQPIDQGLHQNHPEPNQSLDPVKEEQKQQLQKQEEEEYKEEVVEIISDKPAPIITENIIISEELLIPEGQVLLENGVILDAAVAESFELLDSPIDMFKSLFTDPAKLLLALKNLGADMSDETREEAQKIVVVAVIVTSIITMTQIGRVK
jgi:hypothetical protein